jgi:hypothetical protein
MPKANGTSRGSSVAAALAGSWRRSPPTFECSAEELETVAPLLLKSGAAALIWRRVRHSGQQATPAVKEFHQAYRLNTLHAALYQQTLEQVVTRLREAGIEPLPVKGWCAARAYPEEALRPCADIDLCVRPEQFAAAADMLKDLRGGRHVVDLHRGFEKFGGGRFDAIYERAQSVKLAETDIRIPRAEDHLRVLAIHMLREGAWRPLWLCDIGAAVESRPDNFDWNLCLGHNRCWSNWILCALRLAHQLLSADISDTPAAEKHKPLPQWIISAILKEWESLQPSMTQRHLAPMGIYRWYPSGIFNGFRQRWPNPIEATVVVGGSFNRWPRLPFQAGAYLTRGAKFAVRLPKLLRER